MNTAQIAGSIADIKRRCPTAEVEIISSEKIDDSKPGYFVSISTGNAVDTDLVQAAMTTIGVEFVTWVKDEHGEFMAYFVPFKGDRYED